MKKHGMYVIRVITIFYEMSQCVFFFAMDNIVEKAKAPRGKSFTSLEDKNICIAWLSISQDPLKGTDQQAHVFWTAVQQHAGMVYRSWNSIRQRWGLISKHVSKFVGCFEAISRVRVTGKTDEDIYNDAVTLFLEETKTKTWSFCECWEILRNAPKFKVIHVRTPTAKVAEKRASICIDDDGDAESSSADVNSSLRDNPRPIGVKKTKLMVNQQKLELRRATALETIANATIRKNEILADHTEALRAATELKLLTTPEESLDAVSLFILKQRKEEILRRISKTTVYVVDESTDQSSCSSRTISVTDVQAQCSSGQLSLSEDES